MEGNQICSRTSKMDRLNERVSKLLTVAVNEVLELVRETVSEYQEKTSRTQRENERLRKRIRNSLQRDRDAGQCAQLSPALDCTSPEEQQQQDCEPAAAAAASESDLTKDELELTKVYASARERSGEVYHAAERNHSPRRALTETAGQEHAPHALVKLEQKHSAQAPADCDPSVTLTPAGDGATCKPGSALTSTNRSLCVANKTNTRSNSTGLTAHSPTCSIQISNIYSLRQSNSRAGRSSTQSPLPTQEGSIKTEPATKAITNHKEAQCGSFGLPDEMRSLHSSLSTDAHSLHLNNLKAPVTLATSPDHHQGAMEDDFGLMADLSSTQSQPSTSQSHSSFHFASNNNNSRFQVPVPQQMVPSSDVWIEGSPQPTHSAPSGESYVCVVCGETYGSLVELRVHERGHPGSKQHVCTLCGRSFSGSGDLNKHLRVHTGEKPYHCGYCGKSFRRARSPPDDACAVPRPAEADAWRCLAPEFQRQQLAAETQAQAHRGKAVRMPRVREDVQTLFSAEEA
ncbi:hypothetical protein AALO_G00282520 [Alosa alosa]|uniref:C2H2-type domain-containing protein n=1 Tax=Alosa alosa TaxID=278164 RepID=A0AAV6FKM4_9TELE|nr:zinc finger protein 90-like [Alosa alosa]KAG5263095.1 hypothetical protein AALO_G00282520 [Alosa alosa]